MVLHETLPAGVSFDISGNPSLTFGLGDIQEVATLEEIFEYLEKADKPCIVAFDEFQQVAGYAEKMWRLFCDLHSAL